MFTSFKQVVCALAVKKIMWNKHCFNQKGNTLIEVVVGIMMIAVICVLFLQSSEITVGMGQKNAINGQMLELVDRLMIEHRYSNTHFFNGSGHYEVGEVEKIRYTLQCNNLQGHSSISNHQLYLIELTMEYQDQQWVFEQIIRGDQ